MPGPARPTTRWWPAPTLTSLLLAAAVAAVAWRDPDRPGAWGYCPFLLLTGRPCPACGGLRAVADLSHGQWAAAAHQNVLVLVLVPLTGVVLVGWWVRRATGRGDEPPPWVGSPAVIGGIVLAFLVFGVLRLAVGATWLGPS